MGSEWSYTTLGECADWYSGGTPRKSCPEYWDGNIPWISAKSLKDFHVRDSEDRITDEGLSNGSRLVPSESILFVVRGMSLKSEFRLGVAQRPVSFNQDIKAIVAKPDYLPYFLAYALKGKTSEILDLVEEAGHGTGVLPTDVIKKIEIPQISKDEQGQIVRVIKTLDDKIELNRRMNATLEGMAQALFKSWFVDFDPVIDNAIKAGNPIPDQLADRAEVRRQALANGTANREAAKTFPATFQQTEAMNWTPECWMSMKLKDVCVRVFSGGTPRTKEAGYWNGGIPWLSSGETGQRFILETNKSITEEGVENSSTRETRKGSVVIASAGQGKTRGQTSYLCFDSYINQSVIALEADNSILTDSFLFFDLARRYEEFRQLSDAQSSRGSLTTKLLATIDLVVPSNQLMSDFGDIADNAIHKITANARQNLELSKLRDTLLPKLISGELRLEEAKKLVEGSVEKSIPSREILES